MQAVIFCGIQGSGKSTFYKQHFFNSHVRISMDLLRTRNREKLFLNACLSSSARFVVDNTNPTVRERERYLTPALQKRYELICFYFRSDIEAALLRNVNRTGKELIPEIGIRATLKRFEAPSFGEGYSRIYHVFPLENNLFEVQEEINPFSDPII